MVSESVSMEARQVTKRTSIVDIRGTVTAASEKALMSAYDEANSPTTRTIVLNFNELDYLNSTGIGLLVTLLVRVKRQRQRLLAYGLNDHYQQIFELTRLTDAIGIYGTEDEALRVAEAT